MSALLSDTSAWLIALVVVAVVLIALVASRRAARLDRLHRQVIQARAGLDALLVRRASAAGALATCELLDPASSALIQAAARDCLHALPHLTADAMQPERTYTLDDAALTTESQPRQALESVLTQVLRQTLSRQVRDEVEATAVGRELLAELVDSNRRVSYARRFHNDHVARTRALRQTLFVRVFRLAGHAPLPDAVDIDDVLTLQENPR